MFNERVNVMVIFEVYYLFLLKSYDQLNIRQRYIVEVNCYNVPQFNSKLIFKFKRLIVLNKVHLTVQKSIPTCIIQKCSQFLICKKGIDDNGIRTSFTK